MKKREPKEGDIYRDSSNQVFMVIRDYSSGTKLTALKL